MTVSVGSSFIIAAIVVVALVAFIGIVLLANRRPSFKHPQRLRTWTGVRGGVHEGDPRSVSPRRDKVVEPSDPRGQPR